MNESVMLKLKQYSVLEQLAHQAGFTERFIPITTDLLCARGLESDAHSTLEEKYLKAAYWFVSKDYNPIKHKSPNLHWTARYEDVFTRIRSSEKRVEFVDCYEVDEEPMFTKGTIYKESYFDDLPVYPDAETIIMLNLLANRERNPPFTMDEVVLGRTRGEMITSTIIYGLGAVNAYGGLTDQSTLNIVAGGLITLVAASDLLKRSDRSTRWFRTRGNSVNNQAVLELVAESYRNPLVARR